MTGQEQLKECLYLIYHVYVCMYVSVCMYYVKFKQDKLERIGVSSTSVKPLPRRGNQENVNFSYVYRLGSSIAPNAGSKNKRRENG